MSAKDATPGLRALVAGSTAMLRAAVTTAERSGLPVAAVLAPGHRLTPWRAAGAPRPVLLQPADVAAGLPDAAAAGPLDVLVSFLYLRRLPPSLISRFALAINFHPAPLPALRGISVCEFAVLHQLENYWVTCHHVSERYDEGDIVATRPVAIAPAETAGSLYRKAVRSCLGLLASVAERLAASGRPWLPGLAQGPGTFVTPDYIVAATTPRSDDDDATLARKLRARCWDGSTAMVGGRRVALTADGLHEAREMARSG